MVAREQLLKAIEQVESGGRRDAVSPKGARGRMQVMPATARQPGYRVKPARNETEEEYTRVGRDYAMALLNHYGGDLEATLVAYNYGPGNANKWIASGRNKSDLPEETRNYITRVGKQLGGNKMARRPLKAIKQKQLSELTKKAIKNPDSADARKVVRELIARGLPVPNKLKGSIGRARAEAGIGSPAGEVSRPKRKPPAPKAKAVPRSKRKPPVPPTAERGMNNMLYNIDEDVAGRRPFAPEPQEQRPVRIRPPSDFERTYQRGGAFIGSPPLQRRADDIALPFNKTTGNRGKMRPANVDPDLQRGVSRVPRGDMRTGPSSPEITEAQFSYTDPGTIPTEDQFRAMRATDIDEDVAGRRGLPSLELMSNAPQADGFIGDEPGAPYRSSGGRGEMEGNRGYETLREYFIEDMSPRKSNVMTPFGIIEIDSTQEGMFPEEDMYMEKKGGRLKKKKRVARKKAAPKKKKVAAKKKPVVRKKAVAKKPPMRKKTVAKKPAGRKRAAKRGFGAELRGN